MEKILEKAKQSHGDQQAAEAHQERAGTAESRVAPERLDRIDGLFADVTKGHIFDLFRFLRQSLTPKDVFDVTKLHSESLGAVSGDIGGRGTGDHIASFVKNAAL